jgi:hypothetical protein
MPRSLRELFSRIERGVQTLSDQSLVELANEAADLLDQRCQRLQERESIHMPSWGDTLRLAPEQLKDLVTHNDFLQLIRARDVDIVYHLGTGEDNLFLRSTLSVTKSVRSNGRIIFQNSLAKQGRSGGGIVESWSRMYSVTRTQKKHLSTFRGKGSKYLKKVDFKKIEEALFKTGIGLLTQNNCMFLFGRCNKDIGTDYITKMPTKYVCMQCDRSGRALVNGRRSGYKTKVHSFPISEDGILLDCRNSSKFLEYVRASPAISI